MTDKPVVLFVCIHNGPLPDGRRVMRALSGGAVEVRSGGSEPGDQINPVAIEATVEEGIDISTAVPQLMTTEQVEVRLIRDDIKARVQELLPATVRAV